MALEALETAGIQPVLHILDNETSQDLLNFLEDTKELKVQRVPPDCHRRNTAERAIRTYKNHMIAGLCTIDNMFPINLWCKLSEQVEITLNLLQWSRMNPKLMAWLQVHGEFDFNINPFAPPRTKVLLH